MSWKGGGGGKAFGKGAASSWGGGGWGGGKGADTWDVMAMLALMKGAGSVKGGGLATGGGKGGKKGGSKGAVDSPKVFVGGLPKIIHEETVREYFSMFGTILDIKMMISETGDSKGYCFVTFSSAAEAQKVYDNYDSNMIDGKWVDCKPASGTQQERVPGQAKPGDWWCPLCGDLVFAWRNSCNSCGYAGLPPALPVIAGLLGGAAGTAKGDRGGLAQPTNLAAGKPGDWLCPTCSNVCFSHRPSCNKCGTPKDTGAERIGVKHGDWTCPNCGDLVFASKSVCSLCQTPKPAGADGSGAKGRGAVSAYSALLGGDASRSSPY